MPASGLLSCSAGNMLSKCFPLDFFVVDFDSTLGFLGEGPVFSTIDPPCAAILFLLILALSSCSHWISPLDFCGIFTALSIALLVLLLLVRMPSSSLSLSFWVLVVGREADLPWHRLEGCEIDIGCSSRRG